MSPEGILSTDLFGYTVLRQLSQFVASIVFFNGSEYFLAASIHGTSTVDSSCKYQRAVFFVILTSVLIFFWVIYVEGSLLEGCHF